MRPSLVLSFLAFAAAAICVKAQTTQTQTSPEEVRERWNTEFKKGAPLLNRQPSKLLVETVRGRAPGSALDLGTGEGRNAIYLAEQGWKVTGVDR